MLPSASLFPLRNKPISPPEATQPAHRSAVAHLLWLGKTTTSSREMRHLEKKNNTTKASRSLLLPEVISTFPGAQPPPPAGLEQGWGSRGTHGCWLWAATSCTPARAAPAACAPGNWRKGAGAPGDGAGTSPRCSLLNDWLEARQTDRSIKM